MLYLFVLIYVSALYIRPGDLIAALAGVPVIDYLSVVVAAVAGASFLQHPRKFWNQPHDKSFLVYWLAIVVSNPAWGYMAGGSEAFSRFLPVAFTYFLIRMGILNLRQLRGLVRLLIPLNVFLAFNGLLQVFTGAGLGQVTALDTREGIRIRGTGIFNDPNDLGMTLVATVPFLLSAFVARPARFISRLLALSALAIVLTACYYTNSRGTMLGLGAVFTVFAYRRFGLITATTIAGVALSGLLVFGPSRMTNVSADEASAQGRIQAWAAGFEMFFESPATGKGFGRFIEHHERAAHNSFLHVLGELGFLGAVSFVAMFYWYFVGLRTPSPNLPPDEFRVRQRLRHDFADSGIALLACMCFLSRQYTVVVFIIVALGACYKSVTSSKEDPPTFVIKSLATILVLTGAVMAVFYVVARLFAFY